MKRLVTLLLSVALAVTLAWMLGCSGSSSTDSDPKAVGDTNSTEFQTAAEAFDMAEGVDGMVFDGAFDLIGSFMVSGAPRETRAASAGDPVFHVSSMYWYRVESVTETTFVVGHPDSIQNISEWIRIDSLQFLHVDTPKMIPDPALVTQIRGGVQLDGYSVLTDDSVHATRHLQITGAPGSLAVMGDVVINAGGTTSAALTISDVWRDTATICQIGLNMASVWTNLAVNIAAITDSGKCPTAGSIVWNGTLAIACARGDDSLNFNGGWSVSQTHDGDQVTYVIENATTRWTVTEACGDDSQASPFRQDKNPLK